MIHGKIASLTQQMPFTPNLECITLFEAQRVARLWRQLKTKAEAQVTRADLWKRKAPRKRTLAKVA